MKSNVKVIRAESHFGCNKSAAKFIFSGNEIMCFLTKHQCYNHGKSEHYF